MLKNIRLHLEKDEEKQKQLEESLAKSILETHHKNINSFDRNIPSLGPLIKQPQLQNYSLFCNKFGEINIVDYGVGRTLYGFHPKQEIHQQVDDFDAHAPYFSLLNPEKSAVLSKTENPQAITFETSEGYQHYFSQVAAPEEIECLVVLGCGLGLHLLELMLRKKIHCLIIYEPEPQYFQCSILVNKWSEIFALAKLKGSKIFIQVEKDGRNLVNDINELVEYEKISSFYVYKHYNHPVFNSLLKDLRTKTWQELQENGLTFSFDQNYNHYLPTWTANIEVAKYRTCDTKSERFKQNLNALKQYFPDIYAEYKDYQPNIWLPVENEQGQINIIKADSLTPWYSDSPKQDCLYNYQNYNEQPHKDGLVLGYRGTKLAHYLHYQFVKETEDLLAQAEDETGALPEHVASIIMFGLGVGYQLESLLANHTVEKLFLCEPNTDFFYASLFAIDWQHIFAIVDQTKARIYLNIGDDGSHLFRDLLRQFHSIGPYILNNTYFYQSYYNASLNSAIAQLREQLQIVISMGEYFDHAYYGIEHTKEGFRRNIPVLLKNPASKLSYDDKEVPVFIVGNGPSLDLSIEAIKEWHEQAIIISCGTALQALHRHGITPDFHAEIEQNRSTFDWAMLIDDLDYLKTITLISCNGIHPDTCELYKDVLVAFKEGESSTVSALSVIGSQHFEVLQHSFPTVSNFVTNIVSVIGFEHIYLMGVDLGFIDLKHHHSKSSGYYQKDGKETYDYLAKNNMSLIVPGNFRPTVNTKHEFKISRQIIEQVTGKKPRQQTFYNCSDGAKINGTNPLPIVNLLIVSTSAQKQKVLTKLKSSAFSAEHNTNFILKFESTYSHALLVQELNAFEQLLEQDITETEQANYLIDKQKEMLFASYKNGHSLLFYYLYGTVNYANAVLTKLQSNKAPQKRVLEVWQHFIKEISTLVSNNQVTNYDASGFKIGAREYLLLEKIYIPGTIYLVSNDRQLHSAIDYMRNLAFPWMKNIEFMTLDQPYELKDDIDYLIYFSKEGFSLPKKKGKLKTLVITQEFDTDNLPVNAIEYLFTPKFLIEKGLLNVLSTAWTALHTIANGYHSRITIPMFRSCKEEISEDFIKLPLKEYTSIIFFSRISIFENDGIPQLVSKFGTRGKVLSRNLEISDLLFKLISKNESQKLKDSHDETINLLKLKSG